MKFLTLHTAGAFPCALALTLCAGATELREHGQLRLEDVEPLESEWVAKLAPYLQARDSRLLDWTPDGALLVARRAGEIEQVHRIEVPLGAPVQLTFGEDPPRQAAHAPAGGAAGFFLLRERRGDGNTQIDFLPQPEGPERRLTEPGSINGPALWTRDGRQIGFFSAAPAAAQGALYLIDPDSAGPPRLALTLEEGAWYPEDFSPDGTRLLLRQERSPGAGALFIVDLAAARSERLVPTDNGAHGLGAARFARSGQGIYFICDGGGEFRQLRYLDLATEDGGQPVQTRLSPPLPWDVETFDLSPDGRYLAYVTDEGVASRLRLRDVLNNLDLPTPVLLPGRIAHLKFDPGGMRIALDLEGLHSPREVWVYQIGSGALTQWTAGTTVFNPPVTAELVYYPTFDLAGGERSRRIPAFVFKPAAGGPFPVVIDLNGGPGAARDRGYRPFTQFLVKELGVAVITPQVRGSEGYGRSYQQLDDGLGREEAIKDIGALIAWIGQQRDLDRQRVLVMGRDYGGYLSLAALMHFGDRLLGGIDLVGPLNLLSWVQSGPGYRRALLRAEFGDERDPQVQSYLRRLSPFHHSQRITRPVLIAQGLNDSRVSAVESEQMVAALRGRGVEAWYLTAGDEGHGFDRAHNREAFFQAAASFITKRLRSVSDP